MGKINMTTKIKILIWGLFIGVVLIGGWWVWSGQIYPETQRVTITTDQTEYGREEKISLTVLNNLNRNILVSACPTGEGFVRIEKKDKLGSWKEMPISVFHNAICAGPLTLRSGESHTYSELMNTREIRLPELPVFDETTGKWIIYDNKTGEFIETEQEPTVKELGDVGIYRIKFGYLFSLPYSQENTHWVYSNEFKIKEKAVQEVIVTIDKTEYRQGEKVKISLDYEGDLYVWDYPWSSWSIQRKVKDSWVDLQLGFTTSGFSKYDKECKDVPPNKIVECEIYQLEAPAWSLRKGKTIIFTWDQRYIKGQGTYQCSYKDKISTRKCVIYEQVSPGEYKIRLEYALNIKNTHIKEGVDIKYAEKEFEIK